MYSDKKKAKSTSHSNTESDLLIFAEAPQSNFVFVQW